MTHADLRETLGARERKRMHARSTFLEPCDGPLVDGAVRCRGGAGALGIRYHKTHVVCYRPDGSIVLDSGGWRTATTRKRITEHLPPGWGLRQEKGVWYLEHVVDATLEAQYPYVDGIEILADRETVRGAGQNPRGLLSVRRTIRRYAKEYVAAMRAGKVPPPSAGDCWYCLLKGTNGVRTGTMGEIFGDESHLRSHFEEGYFVPALLERATEVFPISPAARYAIGAFWAKDAPKAARKEWPANVDVFWEQIERTLVRYLSRQFKLAA